MGEPRPTKAVLGFQYHKTGVWTLGGQVIGTTDPRNTCTDDQHIEMLGRYRG